MPAEALAEVGAEAVIDGAAVGVVRVHVAEGDTSSEARCGAAGGVESGKAADRRNRLRDASEAGRSK